MNTYFTAAPDDFDGFGTRTVRFTSYLNHRGRRLREVEIENQHLEWQLSRYGSGLFRAYDATAFEEEKTFLTMHVEA